MHEDTNFQTRHKDISQQTRNKASPKTKMNGMKEATSVEQLLILGNKKEDIWNKKKITRNETEVFTAVEKQEVNLVKE